ncbi:MAG TPA: hypothetical protein VMN37_03215 [Gemmatimonadales bacterium]|nr:hypothetical protein [Gemmatimonadales bacterium]
MDQGDAEILERIAAGERVFRPGAPTEQARRTFEALVGQLRELGGRGLIDMPQRSVTQAADAEAGAYLMAGPCYLTDAGRAELALFRGDRRGGERRAGERRGTTEPVGTDRRAGDRRGGDRRR